MSAPAPMLASSARGWPGEHGWVMQPKWDGFRVLVDIGEHREIRAFSRHGSDLTDRLGELLEPLRRLPAATVLDGELVALADIGDQPVQDFAAVGRAALHGDPDAARALHYVAFDLLSLNGHDTRTAPWADRDELLRRALPESLRIRAVQAQPASPPGHDAIVALGFEGTVLKRERSPYRAGRQTSWRKVKARHRQPAILVDVRTGRDRRRYAVCELPDGGRVTAAVLTGAPRPGEPVAVIYSRRDADDTLREARLAAPDPASDQAHSTPATSPTGL